MAIDTQEANLNIALTNLRAVVAMRSEDLRIAIKHREEAGSRIMCPASRRAYLSALRWEDTCREAHAKARGALIRESLRTVAA